MTLSQRPTRRHPLTRPLGVLRRLLEDDPRREHGWCPPRSHPTDPFERTGSDFH